MAKKKWHLFPDTTYQNVELFLRSKTNVRNVAIFKYSWHTFGETILRRKYQLI